MTNTRAIRKPTVSREAVVWESGPPWVEQTPQHTMNPQERALLDTFLDQLVQIHGIQKVPQADAMIRHAVERQPDAAYLLVQRSLMQQQALEQAKSRIAELELAQQDTERSFLEGGTSKTSVPIAAAAAAPGASQGAPAGRAGWSSQAPGAPPGAGSPQPEPPRGMGPAGS